LTSSAVDLTKRTLAYVRFGRTVRLFGPRSAGEEIHAFTGHPVGRVRALGLYRVITDALSAADQSCAVSVLASAEMTEEPWSKSFACCCGDDCKLEACTKFREVLARRRRTSSESNPVQDPRVCKEVASWPPRVAGQFASLYFEFALLL